MSGVLALDWAIMAVSLLNTILLLWLGITVLLNAERRPLRQGRGRRWGIWLAGGSMLLGGVFFISHSSILGHDLQYVTLGLDFWWRVGWVPVVALPLAWYAIMLWYAGFWEERRSALRRRHRLPLTFATVLAVGQVGLFLFANLLPSYGQVAQLQWSATPSVGGVPLLFFYPVYVVLCITLSLDALRRPETPPQSTAVPTRTLARRRARPWLVATSIALLVVSLLVAGVMAWVLMSAQRRAIYEVYSEMVLTVAWFDLIISSLIAVSVLLLGQAIVSYEVFTGKTLPRRGFLRHWRNAVILAVGYSALVSWTLIIQLRPIYSLLLTAMLMVTFYALLSWRSFAERERTMAQLRPFAASQRLYEYLLTSSAPAQPDVAVMAPFRALCDDVLGARVAYLVALGPLAPLVDPPLAYPAAKARDNAPLRSLAEIAAQFDSPQNMCVPVAPARYGGATWAVPLWSERGLIGVLLLGDKRDGGLYTQEEIEIARASGERLIDTRATAELAHRLMALLRQRLAQVKVMEGHGRRVLHDQVLPQLHTVLLYLSGLPETPDIHQAMTALTSAHRQISDLMHDASPAVPHRLAQQGLVDALRASVEKDFDFARVTWDVAPDAVRGVNQLPLFVSEVVFFAAQELVRNAARHGRGGEAVRPLQLKIALDVQDGLRLIVEDDGVGFDNKTKSPAAEPATGSRTEMATGSPAEPATGSPAEPATGSPAEPATGSNSGLRFHSTMLAAVGASLEVMTVPTGGTRAMITLSPETLRELAQLPK